MMQNKQPTVYIIDDSEEICSALRCLIEESLNYPVVVYHDPQTFLKNYKINLYGCLLIDVLMPGMDGFQLLDELKKLDNPLPIIVLTGHGNIPMAVDAMRMGVKDFVSKPFNAQELATKVKKVISDYSTQYAVQEKYLNLFAELTDREKEVVKKVVAGKLNKQVAEELGIKIKTVEAHRFRAMRKLKVRSLVDLIRISKIIAIN